MTTKDKTILKLVVDDIDMGDVLVFEAATGSKLLDALSPRLIKDPDTGKPVMVPESEEEGARLRPLRAVNMSTKEMLGAILVAKRQQDRSNQAQWTALQDVYHFKLSEFVFEIDWGGDEVDSENPTPPEAASTDAS